MRLILILLALYLAAAPYTLPASGETRRSAKSRTVRKPALPNTSEIDQVQAEIERLIEETQPYIGKLKELEGLYEDAPDLTALAAERERIREDAWNGVLLMREKHHRFRSLRKEFQFVQGSKIIVNLMDGDSPQEAERDLKAFLDFDFFPRKIKHFQSQLENALNTEKAAYDKAVEARAAVARKRLYLIIGCASAGVLAAMVAVLLRLASRRSQAVTVTAMPIQMDPETAARGALGGPGQGPALPRRTPMHALTGPGAHTPPPGHAETPDVIGGNYRIVAESGRGPLGPVFEAMDLATNRKVMIKRIREELHQSEKDVDRFLERARSVADLKHPNLAEVYSVFVEDERVHLAVEHVDGKSLAEFLEAGNRINLPSVKRVIRQVAKVLDHAHGEKVIHGDLSPASILVTREGIVKVMDFGIGIEARKSAAKVSWTGPIGSPAYLAPEQELGSVFKESDLFSLGVVFYEMITGNLPFEGPNFLAQKRERRYRLPSQVSADIPKEVDSVVQKALQPEPPFRFHSGAEFLAAVEAVPDSRTSKPSPSGPGQAA
ncbi:MAG: protein kinase [Elusimicrobiota bacterium]